MLAESAHIITLCAAPPVTETPTDGKDATEHRAGLSSLTLPSLSNMFSRSRTPSPEPALTQLPVPAIPRRMVILVVGLKPHRKMWTTSARPGESVINYILCNGCPAIVVPVKVGAPLVAWDGLTLEKLWALNLPGEGGGRSKDGKFEGVVDVFFEYLDLCIDWQRAVVSDAGSGDERDARVVVKDAVTLLIAAAARTASSKEVKKEIDEERCGIAMWRIP